MPTIGHINARTDSFQSSFYPFCLIEWEKLFSDIRISCLVSIFKNRLLSIIHPSEKPVYGIHDPKGLAILTQLRVGLSMLNHHKFRHNFADTVNALCPYYCLLLDYDGKNVLFRYLQN